MKKLQFLMILLVLMVFIVGCTETKTESQTTVIGNLILNQEGIKTIEVIKGATEQSSVTISDSTNISELISKIKQIPVSRLSKSEDESFMPERIQDDSVLNIIVYSDNISFASIEGEFFIWPDGYIYAVDVDSMKSNQRTIAYKSQLKYPDIYEWLIDKADANYSVSKTEAAEQFVKSRNYQIMMNSGAGFDLQLPGSFDEIRNGVEIGELLKKSNELSKQNGLDFSSYLGKQVTLITYAVYNEQKEEENIDLIMDGNKVVGFWIDDHGQPADFNVIVNALKN